jgi:hypothetical protein
MSRYVVASASSKAVSAAGFQPVSLDLVAKFLSDSKRTSL